MPSNTAHSDLFRSLMLYLSHMDSFTIPPGITSEEQITETHCLLIIEQGEGTIYLNHLYYTFGQDSCFLLPPEASFQFDNGDSQSIRYSCLYFEAYKRTGGKAAVPYSDPLMKDLIELPAPSVPQLQELLLKLKGTNLQADGYGTLQQQLYFQQLFLLLMARPLQQQSLGKTSMVDKTLHYLDQCYMEQITVKTLASLAEMPPWQYTSLFKERTGKRPLDYLAELRIERSKQWLIESDEPLRDIAERVGFKDEYYYSRRFRQLSGVAPRQYALSMKGSDIVMDWRGHKVSIPPDPERIIFYGEALGDMYALGLVPVGCSLRDASEELISAMDAPLPDVGNPFNDQAASALDPDLIISTSGEQDYAAMSAIAPTLSYNSWAPLSERLSTLGKWLKREREAVQWLERYQSGLNRMWQELCDDIRPGESATVLIYHRGRRLFVMGSIGLAVSLYHPQGFKPVTKVQDMLDADRAYKEIAEHKVQQYAGDRIFMLVPDRSDSRQAMDELLAAPAWNLLPAARNGHVYLIDSKWNSGDGYTSEKLLHYLPQLLRQA
ncbi:AraC family transcriptional regulator [Paenibacillus gorillae]|uniref:AraC family transcriptional regulator n=1 Tax=Paenibacillus gorillae TaxID=1243662 RepID=UPI0005AA5ED9|nr:ABC transporter substrate-binding protein [Paenibacillus gorillae]